MSDGRKTKFKEPMPDVELPKMKLEVESEAKPETPLTAEQIYQAQGRGGAAGQRRLFELSAGKSRPRSAARTAIGTDAANRAAEAQSAQPADLGGGHRGGGRGGHARLPRAHRAEHPGPRGKARRRHLHRTPAPPHRSRIGQSAGRRGRPALRRLGAADAD